MGRQRADTGAVLRSAAGASAAAASAPARRAAALARAEEDEEIARNRLTKATARPAADETSELSCCEACDSSSSGSTSPSLNVLVRTKRATAGRNSVVRDKKAKEDHDTFWNHEAFQEGSGSDSDVCFSGSALSRDADSSDSDIDKEHDSQEEQAAASEASAEEKTPRHRRMPFKSPFELNASGRGRGRGRGRGFELGARDTRSLAQKRSEAAEAATLSGRAGRSGLRMTQQQRLEEAARTEERNLEELRVRRNSESAAQPVAQGFRRKRYEGPRVRFMSSLAKKVVTAEAMIGSRTGAINTVDFINCGLPEVLVQGPPAVQQHKRLRVATVEPESLWLF